MSLDLALGLCECGCGRSPRPGRRFVQRHSLRGRPAADRFWGKVRFSLELYGCWVWTAVKNKGGYGQFWDGKRQVLSYRWSYERARGPVPNGLQLDHLCRNPSCIRPDHLEAVTQQVNSKRGVHPWKKCPHGDSYKYAKSRVCRVCNSQNRKAILRATKPEGWVPFARKTHCPAGHEYTPENIYMDNGTRKCRICVRARVWARWHRLREARNASRRADE